MSETILIIEDEKDLVAALEYNLQREGFQTKRALTAAEATEILRHDPLPDLVLLDLMLPDGSGTEICRTVRKDERMRRVPVVMLTARGEEIDRVVGFEVGADDYVTKPFSIRELLLRVRAVLRRARAPEGDEGPGPAAFGRLRVDPAAFRVTVDDQEVVLTALEFKLLATFLERRGRVQTRDVLLNDVWGVHADVITRTVDTHVKRLREKLGPAGAYIETLRGIGYRFRRAPDEIGQ
jgi:two-component system phosphate regulon response regulator PhoB